jgi:RNA polymerase sigma factor (sigma-70 family)
MDSIDGVQTLLDRLRMGDEAARNDLIAHTYERLRRLAGRIFHSDFPRLLANHATESVLHQAILRLVRAVDELRPATPRDYFQVAAQHLRWVLLDLARRRPEPALGESEQDRGGDSTLDPAGLAEWTELHERIGALPEKEREVTELLWYHGLTQGDAATILGVSERTVKSRWREARLKLGRLLAIEPAPE